METKVLLLQNELKSDSSLLALKSLTDLKNNILSALSNELHHAHRENEIIKTFVDNDIPDYGTISTSTFTSINYTTVHGNEKFLKCEDELGIGPNIVDRGASLVKYGSNEFFELQNIWKNVLNESIEDIKRSIIKDRITKISNSDIETIYNHILKIYNMYFKTVEERENNHKLWLRLKMHTRSRIKFLNELSGEFKDKFGVCDSINTITSIWSKTNGNLSMDSPRTVHKTYDLVHHENSKKDETLVENPSIVDSNTSNLINRNLSNDGLTYNTLSRSTLQSICSSISEDSNLLKLFELTKSIEQFKIAAKHIYMKYGDDLMSYAVFNNVVLFLMQSLHLPTVYNITVEHILNIYGIDPGSMIDLRTFTLMYWEVINSVKFHVEQLYSVNYTMQRNPILFNVNSHMTSFINISDHYNFVKKLTTGKSCTKYLAKEISTGELRVIELICKIPGAPNFDEVISEINHLKQLNDQNLVKYIAAYHDYNTVYVVSEFCRGLSLLNRLQLISKGHSYYTLSFVHIVFVQLIEALLYLHCNNITHGSLTLDKIMLVESESTPQIKLRGYGNNLIFRINYTGYFDFINTGSDQSTMEKIHAAPEALDGRLVQKSNIWSSGIILLLLLTGKFPTENVESPNFMNQVVTMLSNSQIFPCNEHIKDLVCRMLSSNMELRPSALEIANHPWYSLTNLPNEPRNIGHLKSTLNDLLVRNSMKRNIIEILEKQTSFHINKLEKVINALKLASASKDPDIVHSLDFERILMLERLSEDDIFYIIKYTSTKNGKCSIKEFSSACKLWKICEINMLWLTFMKRCKVNGVFYAY
ncbi:Myb-like DNA-binding domain-containing protein [Theileria equi strain WA]|uniref:Myb-like DNA-binding domain-containing protein n=1 Tax=Theileria equi strain WA TaxID=1537102 RepID=L0B1R0_THEEQ|nr:Myb-like DNA-binding domain-containing protein [Theileria equi strain WA]AFZ81408.1 Myb-like DNA-binding domain-containing protein [Theileria equi strain WA]|eukprot:XP_004831074.1 Myb-like DNA-binding domain-containing protein [Theileria equi strain WA]